MFNLRPALVALAVTVVAATVVSNVWGIPLAAPTTRLFTGDYATGDFSQWLYVQYKDYNGDSAGIAIGDTRQYHHGFRPGPCGPLRVTFGRFGR